MKTVEKKRYTSSKLRIEAQSPESGFWEEVACVGDECERTNVEITKKIFWLFPLVVWSSYRSRNLTNKSREQLRIEAREVAEEYRAEHPNQSVRIRTFARASMDSYGSIGIVEEARTLWRDGCWFT